MSSVLDRARVSIERDTRPRAASTTRRLAGRSRGFTALALVTWAALVVVGAALVQHLVDDGQRVAVGAPPLHAVPDPVFGGGFLWAALVGGCLAWWGPRLAASLPWRWLLTGAAGAGLLWAVLVSSARGADRLVHPLRLPREYAAVLPRVHDLGSFLAGYAAHLGGYPVHVEGHPPGTVVALWLLRTAGLSSPWWAAGLFVVAGVSAVPAVLIATREVAGEAWARRAACFVLLAPAVIWLATSADALFTGITTWGAALVIVATGRRDRAGDVAGFAGGVLLGLAAYFSYGAVLVALVPLTVIVHRRRGRVLAVAAAGGACVVAAFTTAGFWWFDGFLATRTRYFAGVASRRPYAVFLVANLSAFALALGPAMAAGLAHLRSRAMWLLVGAALVVVAVADLTGMSKGEVERIWLPFTPWLLLAGAALGRRDQPSARRPGPRLQWTATAALVAQVATTILIESQVRTPW